MTNIKMLLLLIFLVVLVESGAVMVMLNARPHPSVGFWLWFGGVGVVAPLYALWLCRRFTGRKAG